MRTREMKANIKRGIKFLDNSIPRWRKVIDLDELDLGDPCHCILGQIFNEYDRGIDIFGLDLDDATDLGLGLHEDSELEEKWDEYNYQYDRLTQLWKEALS